MDALWQRRKVEASTYFENLMWKLEELEAVFRQTVKDEPKLNNDLYFGDGMRKIDFVFVYKRSNKANIKKIVNQYISNLEVEGVQFEVGESYLHPELLFIKVHVARIRLMVCSVLLNYEPSFTRVPDAPIRETRIINLPFMYTELTRGELLSEVVQRASESSLGARPKDLTGAERIMITGEILKNVSFGAEQFETGLKYLLENKSLEAAFPLHEQPSRWTPTGTLNDRQLLVKYWARYPMLFKYQPLDLMQKYYGPEVAFYFAFVGFYNQMLIPIAILGALAFAFGSITYDSDKNPFSRTICTSDEVFCPACQDHRYCTFRPVAADCGHSKIHYVLDNICTIAYAIIMCFWATTVSELWKRQENILKYKWNLLTVEKDTRPRPEYTKYATHKRFNKYTGKYEYYIPQKIYKLKVCISWICCGFLAIFVIFMVIATVFLRMTIVYMVDAKEKTFMAMYIENISHLISTTTLFVFMIIFDNIYKYVAKKLTDFERPRTQAQYDKSFIFKLHVLSILNAYAYLYYTAFFKGSFKTYPGDEDQYKSIGILNNDVDEAMGTMLPLSFQLIIILTAKTVIKMGYEFLMPLTVLWYKKRKALRDTKGHAYTYSSWEKDYHRKKIGYYDIAVNEFKTVITQYGYLILFPAAFTLGPLFAFVANVIEIRIDAYKLTKWSRRPVPMRVPGIGAWNSILSTLSYIGIITNCFYIAFTTNFILYVKMYLFQEEVHILNTTFSVFSVSDYHRTSGFYNFPDVKLCLYPGRRFPADHPRKYQPTKAYWETLCNQLISVILLEVLVLGFNKLLSFAIPDMPAQIKERIRMRRQRENAAREKRLDEKFQAENHTRVSITREQIAARLMQMQPDM